MYKYAQIDSEGVCISISHLSGEVAADNMIPLDDDSTIKPGDIYVDGIWTKKEDIPKTLDEVKNDKIAELSTIETENLKTFQSSALGTLHTYVRATDTKDFSELFNGEFAFLNSPLYDGTSTTLWYTVEEGNVPHTKDQFNQMYTDARAHVQTVKYHRASLDAQVEAATTIEEVNAVVW